MMEDQIGQDGSPIIHGIIKPGPHIPDERTFSGSVFRIQTSSPQPLSSEAEERGLMFWRLTRGGARGLAYPGLPSETPIGVF
jgi:hypothetical protein